MCDPVAGVGGTVGGHLGGDWFGPSGCVLETGDDRWAGDPVGGGWHGVCDGWACWQLDPVVGVGGSVGGLLGDEEF